MDIVGLSMRSLYDALVATLARPDTAVAGIVAAGTIKPDEFVTTRGL
jgi:hypothetical protein